MTRDDIIRMAQECRLIGEYPLIDGLYTEAIYQFAALVAAHEREACAVAAWSKGMDVHNAALSMPCDAREVGSKCAEAIRARGKS